MQHVDTKIVDQVATIVLDRPEVRNALNSRVIEELSQTLSDIHQEKRVRAVVLTGKGDHFCSGVDLKEFADYTQLEPLDAQQQWFTAWRELTELCETLLRFPKPVIAAIDGPAIGAGLAIALSADMIIMSDRGTMVANAAHRGLIGGVTAPLLEFRFGAAVAARMLLTGQPIDAEEAFRLGMCCEVTPSDQVWVVANQWAKHCQTAPDESLQATKRILNESIGETLLTNLASGAATGATLCHSESATEGIRSFVEKRLPDWP
jgi:enoyl-CoA hydratase/carnithine racemase